MGTTNGQYYFNGVNGTNGEYLTPPQNRKQLAETIRIQKKDPLEQWLKRVWRKISQPHLGLPLGCNPEIISEVGWGIVFHCDESSETRRALEPLIQHRLRQVGDASKVKVFDYRTGEERAGWLARHKIAAGSIDPMKVPYYLLLVGGPERIPFAFCHQIDVEYAVGLLQFDHPNEYGQYVESLISYENGGSPSNAKEVAYFATRHPCDHATELSADLLATPLANGINADSTTTGVAQKWGFRKRMLFGPDATKDALLHEFRLRKAALLFTATHGVGFPADHSLQKSTQGALLCQDWPGCGNISADHFFAAGDLPQGGDWHGQILFHFACYSAGTPAEDRFMHRPGQVPPRIAGKAFIAQLPQALLRSPNGGALACIGHVERAWGYSISTPFAGAQLLPFQNAVGRILNGQPVGHAVKDFNERYAALSTELVRKLEEIGHGNTTISDDELASDWIERNDAEGYIVIGDPAVRMRVGDLT